MVDGIAPLDLNQIPPPAFPSPAAAAAEMVDGVSSVDSNQIPPPDSPSHSAVAAEMVDGVAPVDLNQIRPPNHPSSSSSATAAPHEPLINYSRPTSPHRWSREEHALFLLGVELYGQRKWRDISKYAVTTRTASQLASHSQKYNDHHQGKKTATRGTRRERIHDLTLPEFGLDNLQHLISSRPLLKHRLKDKDCPFPFHSVLMDELRKRIHDTPSPPPIPQPPTEIPESEEAEKKGTEDKGESSTGRDQQQN